MEPRAAVVALELSPTKVKGLRRNLEASVVGFLGALNFTEVDLGIVYHTVEEDDAKWIPVKNLLRVPLHSVQRMEVGDDANTQTAPKVLEGVAYIALHMALRLTEFAPALIPPLFQGLYPRLSCTRHQVMRVIAVVTVAQHLLSMDLSYTHNQ